MWWTAVDYDSALAALYQAPLESFVAERKRLSAELKAAGKRDEAARFAKLARPPISAWVINQLYFRERALFDELFATAKRVQRGDRDASSEHRTVTNALRTRASAILNEAGHASTEATLRRVAATLGALAATGSFAPDAPGALSADRDPPGFEAWGISNESEPVEPRARHAAPDARKHEDPKTHEAEAKRRAHAHEQAKTREAEARRRAQEHEEAKAREAEAKRRAQERAELAAKRRRLAEASQQARKRVNDAADTVKRLRAELAGAEATLDKAREALVEVEMEQAALANDDEG